MNDLDKILCIYDVKVNVNCIKDDDISFFVFRFRFLLLLTLNLINAHDAVTKPLRYMITESKRLKIYPFKVDFAPCTLKRDVIIVLTVANTFTNHMISFQCICIELKG